MRIKSVLWLVFFFFITSAFVYPQEVPCIPKSRRVNWRNACFIEESPVTVDTVNEKNSPQDSWKYTVFLGGNYSQFTTTDGVGKSGMNLGFYWQFRFWKKFSLHYGIMYTNKRLNLLDKKIRWSDEHSYSEGSDIYLNYNIFELNVLGSYTFQLTENIFISPIIGIGSGLFFRPRSNIDAGESIIQNDPVEDYDYRLAFTDGPPVVFNSGWINHLGLKVSIKQYFGMLTYTNYLKMLSSAGTGDLILNEKIHSFNVLIGVYF